MQDLLEPLGGIDDVYGDMATAVSCNAAAINGQFATEQIIDYPDVPTSWIWPPAAENEPDALDVLERAIKAAEQQAPSSCEQCCKTIKIVVNCNDGGRPNFRKMAARYERGRRMCNYSNTYNCKEGRWEDDLLP